MENAIFIFLGVKPHNPICMPSLEQRKRPAQTTSLQTYACGTFYAHVYVYLHAQIMHPLDGLVWKKVKLTSLLQQRLIVRRPQWYLCFGMIFVRKK